MKTFLRQITRPITTSEWPFMYFVAECMTKSAPNSNGRWNIIELSCANGGDDVLPGYMVSRKCYRQRQQYLCYSHGQGLKLLRYQQLGEVDWLEFQAKQVSYFLSGHHERFEDYGRPPWWIQHHVLMHICSNIYWYLHTSHHQLQRDLQPEIKRFARRYLEGFKNRLKRRMIYLKKSFTDGHSCTEAWRVSHAMVSIFEFCNAFLKTFSSWISSSRIFISSVSKDTWWFLFESCW